jgi:hypothetical protein
MDRLIPKEMIPPSLWNVKDSILHLPPQLITSWEMLLDRNGLREKAIQESPEGSVGGMSKEETDNHLAWRFIGSCARVMLSILDPNQDLAEIPNAFARIFAGNEVFIADLPCGSGAASMSILTVLCELRKQNRLPRMPLRVVIIGGEISMFAQNYAIEAIESLKTDLYAQAITVDFTVMDWDVCDPFSNSDLVRHLTLASQGCSSKLMMLANFSGFLQREGKWKEAQKQFEELFRHSREENSFAIWIEPQRNDVIGDGGFMPRVIKWFKNLFSAFTQIWDDDIEQKNYAKSSIIVKHPIIDGTFRTNLVVVRFDLPLRRKS